MNKKFEQAEETAGAPAQTYARRRKCPANDQYRDSPAKSAENKVDELIPVRGRSTPLILINEISKLFVDKMREKSDSPLSGSYRHLIFHLARRDGRTQLELARLTQLKPPTVSLSLGKLEAEGYVRREADPVDLRQTRVYLTDKGRSADDSARDTFIELEKELLSELSEEECEHLNALLKKVREKL